MHLLLFLVQSIERYIDKSTSRTFFHSSTSYYVAALWSERKVINRQEIYEGTYEKVKPKRDIPS